METVEVEVAIYQFNCPNCGKGQDLDVNSHEFDSGVIECESCHEEYKFEVVG